MYIIRVEKLRLLLYYVYNYDYIRISNVRLRGVFFRNKEVPKSKSKKIKKLKFIKRA